MKWPSIRESSCQCNGSINAVSSYAMTESKGPCVLLLCLKLAIESKGMTCSAGTYIDTLWDFRAGAKLLFFPFVHMSNISSLLFFYFCVAGIREMIGEKFSGEKKPRKIIQADIGTPACCGNRLCAVAQIRGNSQHMIFITWLPWLNTLFCPKRVGDWRYTAILEPKTKHKMHHPVGNLMFLKIWHESICAILIFYAKAHIKQF